MATTVDDQEILKLKKLSGKKKRSRNCFISSSSLTKEDLKLNQFLDGESTMVYALVEVSKDSEKPAKREKIPLNNKDFLHVMQKFMVSKKEKPERKILKPSKRKHVAEVESATTNISKEEKNIQNDALASRALGFSDEANVIYKRSNHSVFGRLRSKERNRNRRRMPSGVKSETEHPHLKILFNRNNIKNQEPKVKREKISPVSRGTNTDIVQTPKVLEEALEAMTLNFDQEKPYDKLNSERKNCFDGCGKDVCKHLPSASPNFLLVPFIITNNQVPPCRKSNSHDSIRNEEQKYRNNLEILACHTDRLQVINDGAAQKCFTDKKSGFSSINIDQISNTTFGEIGTDHVVKNDFTQEEEQEKPNSTELTIGLETKTFTCLHKIDNPNDKKDSITLLNGTFVTEVTDNPEQPDNNYANPEHLMKNPSQFKDCGVQAIAVTPHCDKTVTVPSGTVLCKTSRLVQFPSEVKMERRVKPSTFKRLTPCKSSPLFQTKDEYRSVRMKRASSLVACRKRAEEGEHLQFPNLNPNYEGSLPEDHDHFDEDLDLEVFRTKSKGEPYRSQKSTNILISKTNVTHKTGNEMDKMVTVKQCGKIAKIKIVGNTTLSNDKHDSGVGKIKLELNELGSIKISNKFSRKPKTITTTNNNSIYNNSNNNNSTNSYSKIAISNVSNNVKDIEKSKKAIGNGKAETISRIARRETIQKKVGEMVKPAGSNPKTSAKDPALDAPQTSPRVSKLKKPSTPVRMFTRGKEDSSQSIKSPRIQPVTTKTEVQLIKTPPSAKSTEVHEKQMSPSGSSIPKKELPSPVQASVGDDNPGGKVHELESGKPREEVSAKTTGEAPNVDKQSSPVKSIWALTKVVLYEDGTQSFEVLEASSHPLKYQLNKKNGNKDAKASNEPAINTETNSSDCKNTDPKEKSH